MTPPLRLGLIGAGNWGRRYIGTIAGMPKAVLARVASRNPETRALVGPRCAVSPDWREVALARDLDGLVIAAPPQLHAAMALEAIAAGLPVLVEKPLTMDLGEAVGLLDIARRLKALVLVDHIHLFNPAYLELKRRAKHLGAPRSIKTAGGKQGPFDRATPPLWDYGPHDISMCLDLLGETPLSLRAERERFERHPEGVGENVRLDLSFPGGTSAEVRVGSLMGQKERRFEVRFRREALVFDDASPAKLTLHELRGQALGPSRPLAVEPALPLTRALEHFLSAIRSGSADSASLELGVRVVEILSACAERLRDSGS